MKRIILVVILNAVAFLGFTQEDHPVSWKFSSEQISPLTYKIKFEATIEAPYHIYPQAFGGMGMPTEFSFIYNENVELLGEISEKGFDTKEGEEIVYYKKGAMFNQIVKLKSEKKTNLVFTIKYMACNDQICLPPSKQQFTVSIGDLGISGVPENNSAVTVSANPAKSVVYEDFMLPNLEGKVISSKDITSKSNYTIIDFWASWCLPCRAQGRDLIPIYNKYKSKGFDVIGVSMDINPVAWKKAIDTDGYRWTNVSDLKGFESEISKKYGIIAIPKSFLVDTQGNIVARDLYGKDLEIKLAELLAK